MNLGLKTISKSFYFQFLPAQILGVITIGCLVAGKISPLYLIGTAVMWVLCCGLGIAVGYHRVFSHRTHTLPKWKENLILFFAVFAGQGASIFWVALHRGYHHPHTDQQQDLHSPVVYGRWHAFIGWYLKITETSNPVNIKYAVDLLRKDNHVWFHKNYFKILWGVPAVIALFDWQLSLTAFALVTMIGTIQDNLVNVYGHVPSFISYRNFETRDASQNNLFLGYAAWGQGWHNNHHWAPQSYDFGKGVSGRWWEWDPCNIFKLFLGPTNS